MEQQRVSSYKDLADLEQSKNQKLRELNQRIASLTKELQKTKEDHEKQAVVPPCGFQQSKDPKQEAENQRIQELQAKSISLANQSERRSVLSQEIQPVVLEIDELNPKKAFCLDYLGVAYYNMQDYAKAEQCYLRSARIKEALFSGSTDLATTYNNLGLLYCNTKNYSKAEDYYIKSLKIRELAIPGTSDLATTYNNLGLLYCDTKNYSKAEDYLQKSLRIKEAINCPTRKITRNNLEALRETKECRVF